MIKISMKEIASSLKKKKKKNLYFYVLVGFISHRAENSDTYSSDIARALNACSTTGCRTFRIFTRSSLVKSFNITQLTKEEILSGSGSNEDLKEFGWWVDGEFDIVYFYIFSAI